MKAVMPRSAIEAKQRLSHELIAEHRRASCWSRVCTSCSQAQSWYSHQTILPSSLSPSSLSLSLSLSTSIHSPGHISDSVPVLIKLMPTMLNTLLLPHMRAPATTRKPLLKEEVRQQEANQT
jgi:hypothetical protein